MLQLLALPMDALDRSTLQSAPVHHPRLGAAGLHGVVHGQGSLVVGAAGGADRRPM
jgi:hypothetical protein